MVIPIPMRIGKVKVHTFTQLLQLAHPRMVPLGRPAFRGRF